MTISLTTFIPGTKAKADEVNANFTALKNALDSKASIEGDGSQTFSVANATEDAHAINKSQLNELTDDLMTEIGKAGTKFCAKSGHVSSGKAALFSYDLLELTPLIAGTYANLVISDYKGEQTIISSTPSSLDLTGNSDGTYNIFITSEGTLYILNNTIYKQSSRPTMVVNDIWLDTSSEPFKCIKYSGSSDAEFLDVPLGSVTIDDNTIISVETFPFNQDGHNMTEQTTLEFETNLAASITQMFIPDYTNGVSKTWGTQYTADSIGFLVVAAGSNSSNSYITINGTQIHIAGGSGAANLSCPTFILAKGDIYITSGVYGTITFFPMRIISC